MKIGLVSSATHFRGKSLEKWAGYFLLSGILLISIFMPPFYEGKLTLCVFKNISGIPCPGCGMTRAMIFLGHGDIYEAFRLNPNSIIVFLIITFLWLNKTLCIFSGNNIKIHLNSKEKIMIYFFAGFMVITTWIYNLTVNPWV